MQCSCNKLLKFSASVDSDLDNVQDQNNTSVIDEGSKICGYCR